MLILNKNYDTSSTYLRLNEIDFCDQRRFRKLSQTARISHQLVIRYSCLLFVLLARDSRVFFFFLRICLLIFHIITFSLKTKSTVGRSCTFGLYIFKIVKICRAVQCELHKC